MDQIFYVLDECGRSRHESVLPLELLFDHADKRSRNHGTLSQHADPLNLRYQVESVELVNTILPLRHLNTILDQNIALCLVQIGNLTLGYLVNSRHELAVQL